MDSEGFPYIPASSVKGALRVIVRDDKSREAAEIKRWYEQLLREEKGNGKIRELYQEEPEALKRIEKRYSDAIAGASASYLFGIQGFNRTPKLLFNDFKLKDKKQKSEDCFSIDTKTAIDSGGREPKSNPRTYKAVRSNLEFESEIEFWGFGQPPFDGQALEKCRQFIAENLLKFNDGSYRLGNSKSRGYGKISVSVMENSGGEM